MKAVSEVREASRLRLVPMAVAMVAMLVGLVWAPAATAASDPIASGTTTLTLNKGLYKKLKKNGVKVLKVSPGRVKNRTVTLPVGTGSSVDPTTGAGTINHSGGFKFKKGKRTAALKNLVLDTTTNALTGKVANKSMKIASVSGVSVTRNGFGANITIGKLKLTGKAAKRLNSKLAPSKNKSKKSSASASAASNKLFKGGQVLGSASSTEQPSTVAVVPGGEATLLTSLDTVARFQSVFVDFVPIAPATERLALPPSFFFPIGGGTIAPDASGGTVQTLGGVRLVQRELTEPRSGQRFQLSMTLNAIWIDLSTKVATVEVSIDSTNQAVVPTPGNVGRSSIANLNLTGATIVSDPVNRTVSISNASATLQAVTAATLNEVFAKPLGKSNVFAEGDSLGTFSFTAQTQ